MRCVFDSIQDHFDVTFNQAAEAIGAISASSSVPILKQFLFDPERTVRETCEIAIAKIEWDNSEEGQEHQQLLNESTTPWVLGQPFAKSLS